MRAILRNTRFAGANRANDRVNVGIVDMRLPGILPERNVNVLRVSWQAEGSVPPA
jgi:hypothetical protein